MASAFKERNLLHTDSFRDDKMLYRKKKESAMSFKQMTHVERKITMFSNKKKFVSVVNWENILYIFHSCLLSCIRRQPFFIPTARGFMEPMRNCDIIFVFYFSEFFFVAGTLIYFSRIKELRQQCLSFKISPLRGPEYHEFHILSFGVNITN